MGRFSWTASVITISVLMGGCSLFLGSDEPDLSTPVAESPASRPSPQLASPPPRSNSVLIQSTNPEQRLRTLKGGRVDPFRTLVPSAKASASSSSGSTPSSTAVKASPSSPETTDNQSGQTPNVPTPSTTRSLPKRVAVKTPTSKSGGSQLRLPTLPQPDAARDVQVTGIVSVGGVPRAIVKAPGETISRSVGPGERLANGQVLVKRIDVNGSEPVVILEQYGTEVAVGVGKRSS